MATKRKMPAKERRCFKRGEKKKTTKMPRETLDRILEARHKAQHEQKQRERRSLKTMREALLNIWAYIVDPVNRISNHDAEKILAIIKAGVGPLRSEREK